MNLPGELIAQVVEHRSDVLSTATSQTQTEAQVGLVEASPSADKFLSDFTVAQAKHVLAAGLPVAVHLFITHESCKEDEPIACPDALPFEVWTFQRQQVNDTDGPALLPLFLKQAVKSMLHFSPLMSWITKNSESVPSDVLCTYRITTDQALHVKDLSSAVETRSLPICKYAPSPDTLLQAGDFLAVKVSWIRSIELPFFDLRCFGERRRISGDDDEGSGDDISSPSLPPTPPATDDGKCIVERSTEAAILTDFVLMPVEQTRSKPMPARRRERHGTVPGETNVPGSPELGSGRFRRPSSLPVRQCKSFSSSATTTHFHPRTRLPLNSSPAPLKRTPQSLAARLLRDKLGTTDGGDSSGSDSEQPKVVLAGPTTNNALLCNFEESALNGRFEPVGSLDGFILQLVMSGPAFTIPHTMIPLKTYFFDVSDDKAPSLYLGQASLRDSPFKRKAVQIPKKCIVQATLFNPQGSVMRIFIVRIDVPDIPPLSRTFIRQRIFAAPTTSPAGGASTVTTSTSSSSSLQPSSEDGISAPLLRYLINLRLGTDRAGRLFLHTDIRLLFSNKTDLDVMNLVAERRSLGLASTTATENSRTTYQLLTATEMPQHPKYSPTK